MFDITISNKLLIYIITGLIAFFAPITEVMIFVGAIVTCDFITGIIKARKTATVRSDKMADKFYVSIGYFIGIIIAHYCELVFGNSVPIVKAVVAIIGLTEIQSVRENITVITGMDILKPIINLLNKKSPEQ